MDLNEQPKRTVGIISFGIDDFLRWKEEQGHQVVYGNKDTVRRYVCNNTTYIRLRTIEDCRGIRFDEIYEADRAKDNRNYDRMVRYLYDQLNRLKSIK